MTQLTKPVRRETATFYRGRALMVTLYPRWLEVREKGRRDTLTVDYATIYDFCHKLRFRQAQQEKAAAKKLKQGRR